MPGKLQVVGSVENAVHEAVQAPLGTRVTRHSINETRTCILSTHDETFSRQDVLIRPDLFTAIPGERTVLQITSVQEALNGSPAESKLSLPTGRTKPGKQSHVPEYVCTLRDAGQDVLSRLPTLEISLLTPIANALGFRTRTKVIITEVEEDEYSASHVEIAFKDAYLTRADLWRLLTTDLVGTSIYKNQKVMPTNSVKASLKNIYVKGRKMQSALLGGSTKAIFRSESSGYYILLQMSKEMWDFDADGGGEIMFNKVINGFLPELFRRWEALGTTHTVSVVLFTRLDYIDENEDDTKHRDFYRVITTELTSGETETVLQGLKHEFKTFLRDVSVTQPEVDENGESARPSANLHGRIRGKPAPAIHGNILEAIHTASLQFLRSNVTCDLRRTGLSLIVITPGPGVFEVSRDLLLRTTDMLIENGIYIDLVSLSRMPLHSSPLFKYKTGRKLELLTPPRRDESTKSTDEWQYAIPHWADVSFWDDGTRIQRAQLSSQHSDRVPGAYQPFIPRVRMYEIQMMGLMQNEFSISVPHLIAPTDNTDSYAHVHAPHATRKQLASGGDDDLEGAKAVYNQGNQELGSSASPSKSPSQGQLRHKALANWMDDHDESIYSQQSNQTVNQLPIYPEETPKAAAADTKQAPKSGNDASLVAREKPTGHAPALIGMTAKRKVSSASTTSQPRSISGKPNPFSRQLSYNFMGFGAAKAVPTTSISTNPISVQASSDSAARAFGEPPLSRQPSSQAQPVDHDFPSTTLSRPSTRSSVLNPMSSMSSLSGPSTPQIEHTSRPIDIRPSTLRTRTEALRFQLEDKSLYGADIENESQQQQPTLAGNRREHGKSPWMTVLNPSNPKHLTADLTSRLGRWQHVFPKPAQASTIKWKSLCSPAVLPLTTEDFPTREQLLKDFTQVRYVVSVPANKDIQDAGGDTGEWLVRELIASRLTRGFSVVVGTRPAEALGLPKAQWYEFLHEKGMSKEGVKIIMSRGKEVHQLLNQERGVVEVTRYMHQSIATSEDPDADYRPLVRTAYASHYVERHFSFAGTCSALDWERLDSFIANSEEEANKPYPESIQYWRARFVLIPIAVSGARTRHRTAEDSEEEIRLEGIQKLTHMWQKNRYLSPNERKFDSSNRNKKETNPLDLVYETRTPSAVVADLNETILTDPHEQRKLLPESELFEKAKLNLSALGKAMQGDRGIRLLDRRWHWRLHYWCFIGLELVTWLVNNFRDIETRDEAVELGNELMKEGLFVHVERRHNFRDGNFFYQIAERYRTPRNEPKTNWLSRLADRSVPPTPMTDTNEEARGLRPVSSAESTETDRTEHVPIEPPQRSSVLLSKQLVYDMDHRKKSHRRELVNLHIDRISSVDDCYHLRIDWVTATPKLIEDTLEVWASSAERSGLRLVEVPLLEAYRFKDVHPFRHPYTIKLAKEPPKEHPRVPSVSVHRDGSKSAQHPSVKWPYQKAILKKFDFVLDLEAADDFPPNVDVTYSWGRPDYRHAQFITRNGRLLSQITDEGHILLVINQLFSERGSAAREAQRAAGKEGERSSNANRVFEVHRTGFGGAHYNPPHHVHNPHLNSPLGSASATTGLNKTMSPFSSPMLKAAGSASPRNSPYQSASGNMTKSQMMNLQELRKEFEDFCSDPHALERFYEEEMHRPPATVPATPLVHPVMSGLVSVAEEISLPAFSLKG